MIPAAIDAALPCASMRVIATPGRPDVEVRCWTCTNCVTIHAFEKAVRSQALEDAAALCDGESEKYRQTNRLLDVVEYARLNTCIELAAAIRGKKFE